MANAFTPEQIAQILEEFFKTVGTRQYIGARYVPIFGRKDEESIEWDNTKPYEPLTIVLYQGNSYTSRQYVPAGVQITNDEFWAITGNYNAQVEQYRRDTARALQAAQNAQGDIDTLLPKSDYSAENTVSDNIASVRQLAQAAQGDIDTLLPKTAFSADNTVKRYIDENPNRIHAFATTADMQAASYLKDGMICRTSGFHTVGDRGAAYYNITSGETANGRNILAVSNDMQAVLIADDSYVTPEQFGAYGNGSNDDTDALQACIEYGQNIVGSGNYLVSSKIVFDTNANVHLYKLTCTNANSYAASIGNGKLQSNVSIDAIEAAGSGVIVETQTISGRITGYFGNILANNGDAFTVAGGSGGVLDSNFAGEVWSGSTCGLRIAPNSSYVGNLKFNGIRFNANENNGTSLVIDSENGSITQLFFPECSIEPDPDMTAANGLLINVVKEIEYISGYFRSTELTGKSGYILKIKGNVTNQIPECMHLAFDKMLPTKIDLSELTMPRYNALDNPIAKISVGQFVFNGQPQTNELYIVGNRIKFKPTRKLFVAIGSDYEFPTTYDKNPWSAFEATTDCDLYLPSWLMEGDEILVKSASHNVTLKYKDFDGTEVSTPINSANWLKVGIYRTSGLAPTIYAI